MQHQQALATKASERYLLGEMNEPERFAFEAHYFDCSTCAADVRTGAALARGIKAVYAEDAVSRPQTAVVRELPRRSWFSWLSPAALVPSTAALAFGFVAAWQGLIVNPSLRWAGHPQVESPTALVAAARGPEQVLVIDRAEPMKLVSLDINGVAPGAPLTYQLNAPNGANYTGDLQAPKEGSALIVMLPTSTIRKSDTWVLHLRDKQGTELPPYTFSIKLK